MQRRNANDSVFKTSSSCYTPRCEWSHQFFSFSLCFPFKWFLKVDWLKCIFFLAIHLDFKLKLWQFTRASLETIRVRWILSKTYIKTTKLIKFPRFILMEAALESGWDRNFFAIVYNSTFLCCCASFATNYRPCSLPCQFYCVGAKVVAQFSIQ